MVIKVWIVDRKVVWRILNMLNLFYCRVFVSLLITYWLGMSLFVNWLKQ